MSFSKKLKQLREDKGLSQQELADASGVSVWAIRDYEQGKRRFDPGLHLLVKLSKALKVSLDVFADCVTEDAASAPKRPGKPKSPPAVPLGDSLGDRVDADPRPKRRPGQPHAAPADFETSEKKKPRKKNE